MALDNTVKVALPEHGIAYKKIAGKTYVYYVTATYRNEKGQPTCDRSSIGKLDEESGMLIPNRNYYEIYLKTPQPTIKGIYDYGVNYTFETIAEKLGITRLLKKYFAEHYKKMLTVAQYMLDEGNVMYYLDDYTQGHTSALNECMGSAKSSKLFSALREEDMLLFFREWMKQKRTNEYVAYDVTSISSYGRKTEELEWGYNRDKERLPQVNMGMYYGEESGLPLYYRIYPGSISDKAHMKYMVADNEFINGKNTRFVMDRGFYSADNLHFLNENGYRFVVALPSHLKYCSDLIKKHKAELVNRSENMLGTGLPYGKAYEVTELGFRMRVHLYYDPDKALRESEALYELLERQENDLKSMDEPPDRKLRYDRYFFINRSKDGKLGFVRNHKAIDEQLEKCGFFLIGETDFKKTTAEILDIYRRRDVIEKSFDNLKNDIDMKRLRTHNSDTMHGKVFISFISLIVRSYILKALSPYMKTTGSTFRKILLELDKIKRFELYAASSQRLLNPLTKTQRDIFAALDILSPSSV